MPLKIGGMQLTTPGDIIVGGGAYAAGFAIDAFFFSGGATSAEAGAASAIGALSTKYAAQKAVRWMFGGNIEKSHKSDSSKDEIE